MGVRRLKKFLDENYSIKSSVVVQADLKELARQWKEKNGTRPVILLDGQNIVRLFRGNLNSICGGEYKTVAKQIEDFVDAFKAISIDLVFFFDGPVDESKVSTWISRRNASIIELEGVFRYIEHSSISSQTKELHPAMISTVVRETVEAAGCKSVTGLKDQDREMARYVAKNGYMGVITDDTDFFIFDGIPHVFTAEDLNLDKMTTKEVRRDALARALNMSTDALPMFATLMGNDCVEYNDSMSYFKRKYFRKPLSTIVREVATVAESINKRSGGNIDQAAKLLAEEIYSYQNKSTWNSLDSYDWKSYRETPFKTGNEEWDKILESCVEQYMKGRKNNLTLLVMTRQLMTQNNRLEDTKDPCAAVLSDLRQRLYSVLLYEKTSPHGECVLVKELCAAGPGSLFTKSIKTIKVEVDHPGLLKLWADDEELDEQRWKLIWWVVCASGSGSSVTYEKFARVRALSSDTLKVVALVLLYIFQVKKKLEVKEVQAFMTLTASLPLLDFSSLIGPKYTPTRTTKRAVTIATLYQQTYLYVLIVLDVCGVNLKIKTRDSYSGNLFHYILQQDDATAILDDLQDEAKKNFNSLSDLLLE